MGAIYQVKNNTTGRAYIGSSVEPDRRMYHHKWALEYGRHDNIHLQRSWDKHGQSAFDFVVLESGLQVSELEQVEEQYIVNTKNYNIAPPGRPPTRKGVKLTEEHKAKISAATRGRKLTQQHKDRIAASHRGKKRPRWIIEKMREANRGKRHSPELRARMAELRKKPITLVSPGGEAIRFASRGEALRAIGKNPQKCYALFKGKRDEYNGWRLKREEEC